MNKSKTTTSSQRLVNEIQLGRIRVAKAESSLESAREQARIAKRRRKEARQAARRARKQVKLAKADLQEAKQVLLATEEKLALARKREALARQRAKTPRAAKTVAADSGGRKQAAAPRRRKLALSAPTPTATRAKQSTSLPRHLEKRSTATASMPEDHLPAPGAPAVEQRSAGQPEPAATSEPPSAETPEH